MFGLLKAIPRECHLYSIFHGISIEFRIFSMVIPFRFYFSGHNDFIQNVMGKIQNERDKLIKMVLTMFRSCVYNFVNSHRQRRK